MKKAFCLFIIYLLLISIHSYALNDVYTNIDTCLVNILPGDTIIYSNSPIQIQLNISPEADTCHWTPSTGLSNDTIPNPIATVNNTTQYIVESYYLIDSNLVYNGDFELGNTGFLTQYTNWTTGGFIFGNYKITTNANTISTGFTPCDNGGKYMVLDGIGTPNTYFFQSTVNVEPNTLYEFSVQSVFLAFTELSPAYYPRLKYYINNQQLGGVDVIPNYNCNWHTFKYKWYSGTNTTATVKVVDDNTDGSGNDFAVDNILLKKICKATDRNIFV
ncbi:MAG: type sorting protein [Bacteroidetes bacterium]|nr:type sorting protein [Bacteroidota bacterium]